MSPVAKGLIAVGLALVALGLLWHIGGKYLPLGRLPGDLRLERGSFRLYLPVATCLLVSAVATLALWLLRYLRR